MSALALSGFDTDAKEDDLTLTSYKGKLGILIKSCNNLAAKDVTGSSDPYVKFGKVATRNASVPKGLKTTTKQKQLNPVWGESFVLELQSDSDLIKFEVWDKDPVFDDFLGECALSVRALVVEVARGHISKHAVALKHNLAFNYREIRDQLAATPRQFFLLPRAGKKETVTGYIKFDVSLQLDQIDALILKKDAIATEMEEFEKAHANLNRREKAEARSLAKQKKQAADSTAAQIVEALNEQLSRGLSSVNPAELISSCPIDQQQVVEARIMAVLSEVLQSEEGRREFRNPKSLFLEKFVRLGFQRGEFPPQLVEPLFAWGALPEAEGSAIDLLIVSVKKCNLSGPAVQTFLAAKPYSRAFKKLTIVVNCKYGQGLTEWASDDYALLARHISTLAQLCKEEGIRPELQALVELLTKRVVEAEHNVLCLRKDPSQFSYDTVETARIKSKHQKMWQALGTLISVFLERPADPVVVAIMKTELAMLVGDGLYENRRILSLSEEFFLSLKTAFRKEWKTSAGSSVSLLVTSDADRTFPYAFSVGSHKKKIEEKKA